MLDAERDFYEHANAAVHRGAHTLAVTATELFEDARANVAAFVGADADELVWTSNATEALNLVAYSMSNASLRPRARTRGCGSAPATRSWSPRWNTTPTSSPGRAWPPAPAPPSSYIPLADDGSLRMDAAAGVVGPRTRILAFSHVSNVLGAVNPVAELVALAEVRRRDHRARRRASPCRTCPST